MWRHSFKVSFAHRVDHTNEQLIDRKILRHINNCEYGQQSNNTDNTITTIRQSLHVISTSSMMRCASQRGHASSPFQKITPAVQPSEVDLVRACECTYVCTCVQTAIRNPLGLSMSYFLFWTRPPTLPRRAHGRALPIFFEFSSSMDWTTMRMPGFS